MTGSWARRWLGLFSCVACVLLSTAAHADTVKILFVAKEVTPFSARVRAEIEAMGFELVDTDVLDAQGRSATRAAAYVIETPPPRRVELWLQDPSSGRLELSTTIAASVSDESAADDAPETVRASEQLRAFFQPLRVPESAQGEPGPSAPASAAPAPPPTARVRYELKPAPPAVSPRFFGELALAIPLEMNSPGLDAVLRGGWWALPRLSVGGKLGIPLLGSRLESGRNSANISTTLFGAELSLLVVDARALRLIANAGLALAWLRATGQPVAPYTNTPDSAFAALPSLGSELGLILGAHSHLCFGADLGIALPKLEIAFAGKQVATWGRPFGLLFAGVGLDF